MSRRKTTVRNISELDLLEKQGDITVHSFDI